MENTEKSSDDSKAGSGWKKIAIIAVVIGVFYLLGSGGDPSTPPTSTSSKYDQQTAEQASGAFKLASLEVGYNSPPQSLVSSFDQILTSLKGKCPKEDEDKIAGYIFTGKRLIEKQGQSITLMQVAKGIDQSLPDDLVGMMSCAEVSAAFVTLTIQ